jgi:hypothetical protein
MLGDAIYQDSVARNPLNLEAFDHELATIVSRLLIVPSQYPLWRWACSRPGSQSRPCLGA